MRQILIIISIFLFSLTIISCVDEETEAPTVSSTSPSDNDVVIDGEIKALVDDQSAPLIDGSNIDYVEGFQRSGFVISNPNFPGGCACGNSGGCGSGGGGCGSGGGGCGCGGGGGGGCGSH